MKALARLQSAVLFQAAETESVAAAMSQRARQFIAFGVLLAASVAATSAHADVLTPSNCAIAGSTVGGLVGSTAGKSNVQHSVGAVLGALSGAAAGAWLCAPSERSKDSSYNNAANYGVNASSVQVGRSMPKAPLSITETDALNQMSKDAIDAKYEWKHSLWNIDHAKAQGFSAGVEAGLQAEAVARQAFESKRVAFSTTVAKLNNGVEGTTPKAVGRYIEISASLLELSTESKVSYASLEAKDAAMQQRSPAYHEEADRVARQRQANKTS